jgi:hypothetical protein
MGTRTIWHFISQISTVRLIFNLVYVGKGMNKALETKFYMGNGSAFDPRHRGLYTYSELGLHQISAHAPEVASQYTKSMNLA